MKILYQPHRDLRYGLLENRLNAIQTLLYSRNLVADSGASYPGKLFTFRPYYWGDCDCPIQEDADEEHLPNCPVGLPNFESGPLKVWWYKAIGRAMDFTDVPVSEINGILNAVEKEIVNSC